MVDFQPQYLVHKKHKISGRHISGMRLFVSRRSVWHTRTPVHIQMLPNLQTLSYTRKETALCEARNGRAEKSVCSYTVFLHWLAGWWPDALINCPSSISRAHTLNWSTHKSRTDWFNTTLKYFLSFIKYKCCTGGTEPAIRLIRINFLRCILSTHRNSARYKLKLIRYFAREPIESDVYRLIDCAVGRVA